VRRSKRKGAKAGEFYQKNVVLCQFAVPEPSIEVPKFGKTIRTDSQTIEIVNEKREDVAHVESTASLFTVSKRGYLFMATLGCGVKHSP